MCIDGKVYNQHFIYAYISNNDIEKYQAIYNHTAIANTTTDLITAKRLLVKTLNESYAKQDNV